MSSKVKPGLGELLRYVGELVDQGAEEHYRDIGLQYRPRYTPVLRAMSAGAETVTDITARSTLTQGAISQTVSLMLKDGILARHQLDDGRKTGLHLTRKGKDLLKRLEPHWAVTFLAIGDLEAEVGLLLQLAAGRLAKGDYENALKYADLFFHGRSGGIAKLK